MSDTAAQRLSRVLALIPWLAAHDGVTIAEAAQHFGISDKQLEDDLWLAIMCGIPGYMPDQLIDIDFWDDGRIRVIEPLTLTRPMRLSSEEAITLLISLRLMAQVPGIAHRDAIFSVMAKIEQSMDSQRARSSLASDALIDTQVDEAVLSVLDEAGGAPVVITYASGTDDAVSERVIEIERTLSVDGLIYLDAYCHSAQARRTFRLDRVLTAQIADQDPWNVREFATDAPAGPWSSVPELDVVLEITPEARWLVDVYGAEVLAHDPYRIRLVAHSPAWVVRLVMSLGGAATVVEPASLRLAVLETARAARQAYQQA